MKKILFIITMLYFAFTSYAYENSMLNMYNPTSLEKGQGQVFISHRFYGDITDDPIDNLFGTTSGVNIGLGYRYQFFPKTEATFNYTKFKKDTLFGLSYKLEKEDFPIFGQINFQYFTFKEPLMNDERRGNFNTILSLQNEPVFERLTGTVNVGYDLYYERPLLGMGVNVMIFDKVYFIGEYFPVLDRNTQIDQLKRYLNDADSYALGLKFDTYGHHFKFQVSNSSQSTLHRITMGSPKSAPLMFGFNIERRLGQ